MVWLQFIISAGLVLVAGTCLTKFADRLSDALGLGKVWIGVVLLGFVTSLPEAGSSLVSVIMLRAGDLAVGNMAGSNNFNLLLIVFLDFYYRKGAVTNAIPYNRAHGLSALFAVTLAGIVVLEICLARVMVLPEIFGMSVGSVILAGWYFYGMRRIYQDSVSAGGETDLSDNAGPYTLAGMYARIAVSAFCVVLGSAFLASAADVIAHMTGLGQTFVGSVFLAVATSLPELVVTVSALRLGQADLAIGNIFGSNMINMFLLAVCDLFFRGKALLQDVSTAHIFTLAVGFVMTFLVIAGLKQDHKRTVLMMGWDSWAILATYILGMLGLYLMT